MAALTFDDLANDEAGRHNTESPSLKRLADLIKEASYLFFDFSMARKAFLVGPFEEKVKKTILKLEPSNLLFGDNFKTKISAIKETEKIEKQMKKPLVTHNNNVYRSQYRPAIRYQPYDLNGRSSTENREVARESSRRTYYRQSTSRRLPAQSSRETRRYYTQSHPQQRRR